MLRSIERKIEGLIERTFGRAFRSELQPVELARKLAREMEQHKTVSVSRVYVPNEFAIYLSGADREHFASYENSLRAELANYLDAHARGEGLSMVGEAVVIFETDSDLRVGEFGIACRMADNPGTAAPPVVAPESAASDDLGPSANARGDVAPAQSTSLPADASGGPAPGAVPAPTASDPFSAHVSGAGAGAVDPVEVPEPEVELDYPAEVEGGLPADQGDLRDGAEDAAVLPPADVGDALVAPEPAEPPGEEDPEVLAPRDEPEPSPLPEELDVIEAPPEAAPEPPVDVPVEPPLVDPALGGVAAAGAAGAAAVDPPPVHDALEGVSGTQIFTADQAREAGVPTEEMTLVLPGGARHVLNRRVTTLGRGRGNDLVIPDANISRNHAEIRHIGLDYFLVDLDSTNGVEVNGEQVRRHALAHGDVVVVGTTEIVVELG